jgi:uncharacterized protein involved in outer membrane biogenesis
MLNRKLLKYFLYLLISLIAIISLSLFALRQLISPERYKPLISQLATQEIGAKLEIGSINWDLWPSLALTAHNVSLSNNNQILTTPLASASTCEVILQLKPLLHGQIYIDKVILHNPKLSLITDGNNNNWDFTTPPTAHNTSMIMQLSSIKLKNASIEYQDFSQDQHFILNPINLMLNNGQNGSMRYYTNGNIININQVDYELNDQISGKLDFNYADLNYSGKIDSRNFALYPFLRGIGLSPTRLFKAQPLQNANFKTNFTGTGHSLNLTDTVFKFGSSSAYLELNATSLSPFKAHSQLQVDQFEASEFVPLNGYHLLISNLQSSGTITNQRELALQQNLHIKQLTLMGYNLHELSSQISGILSNPIKLITLSSTIAQIKTSVRAASSDGNKNYHQQSNLGSLSCTTNYKSEIISFSGLNLAGADLIANGSGNYNLQNKNLNAKINARFVADPSSLTGKVVYPITLSGYKGQSHTIDWNSVNSQIAANLGSSIGNTGKAVGNGAKTLGQKISSWF